MVVIVVVAVVVVGTRRALSSVCRCCCCCWCPETSCWDWDWSPCCCCCSPVDFFLFLWVSCVFRPAAGFRRSRVKGVGIWRRRSRRLFFLVTCLPEPSSVLLCESVLVSGLFTFLKSPVEVLRLLFSPTRL